MKSSPYHRRFSLFAVAFSCGLTALISLAGCGGGTTASIPSSAPAFNSGNGAVRSEPIPGAAAADGTKTAAAALPKTRVGVFLTATPTSSSTAYNHVWTTIYKVELVDDAGKATSVYDGTDGATFDLADLHDEQGIRYAALTAAPLAEGGKSTTQVRLTLGHGVTLFSEGKAVGDLTPLADSVARDAEGRPVISFPLSHARDLGTGKETLVIDFDLAKFTVKDGAVLPALREGDSDGLADASRQNPIVFDGTVSDFAGTAPAATFLLTGSDNQTVPVRLGGETSVFNDGPDAKPVVSDGRQVQVRGYLDPATMQLTAIAAKVSTEPAAGGVAALAAARKPAGNGNSSEGTASSALASATASTGSTSLAGPVASVDTTSGAFALRAEQVGGSGAAAPSQEAVAVTLAPDAVLRSRGGLKMTPDAFLAALSQAKGSRSGQRVRIEGAMEPVTGTFTATRARLEDAHAPSAFARLTHEAEVTGVPSASDAEAGTLKLPTPLLDWDGLAVPNPSASAPAASPKPEAAAKPAEKTATNSKDEKTDKTTAAKTDKSDKTAPPAPAAKSTVIAIATTAATSYRDEKGQYLASAHFYQSITDGKAAIHALGVYANGVLTASVLELRPIPAPPAAVQTADAAPGSKTDAKNATEADAAKKDVTAPAAIANPSTPDAVKKPETAIPPVSRPRPINPALT